MLKYYSYYNVGGYKDLFLGDSTLPCEHTYFIPLYSIWKRKAESGDASLAAKVEALEQLHKMQVLTGEDSHGLPQTAKTLISHGGYKTFFSRESNGESIFAIRDIDSNSKDETGRNIPFLLIITGTTDADRIALERVAAYTTSHIDEMSGKLASLFSYDANVNGIAFDIKSLTKLIEGISKEQSNSFLTLAGQKFVNSEQEGVSLFTIPEGLNKEIAIREQKLTGKKVYFTMMSEVVPLDNQTKLISMLADLNKQEQPAISNKHLAYIIMGAIVLGFLIGYLIG